MPVPVRILAFTLALTAGGAIGAVARGQDQGLKPGVSLASGVDDLAVLTGPDAEDGARFDAARRLVVRTDEATATALVAALRDGESPSAQRAVARAIVAGAPGSPKFWGALRDGLGCAKTPECVADILTAMNDYPPRAAAAAAIARMNDEATSARIRALLSASLLRWTACEPCADAGPEGWSGWWGRVEPLDDAGWQSELATNFRRRAERLSARNAELGDKVVDLYSALYSATPAEQRSGIIASMLRDPLPRANRLGLDLASRTLLNAQTLSEDVARAAVTLLASPDEPVRADSARLLENLGAPIASDGLAAALAKEQSPRVAAPLLRAISRNGAAAPAETLVRWLREPEPASSAAADALLAVGEAHAISPEIRREILVALGGIDPERATASHARLLASFNDDQQGALREIALHATNAGARAAAARSLARDEGSAAFVIDGAASDPAWFAAAALAVELHRPVASSFLELMRLAPVDAEWLAPAAQTLAALPSDQRLIAVRAIRDPGVRDSLLTAALPKVAARSEEQARELHLMQAETRLEQRNPEAALASAERALRDDDAGSDRADRVRFFALVDLGRLNEALAATPGDPPVFWLEALRRCRGADDAERVLAVIDENFVAQMTPDQRSTLDSLRRRPPTPSQEGAEGDDPAPGSDHASS